MARIRKVEIENFRSIKKFQWFPSNGLNCLIGAGDSGKSTILDAIDWCLGARRNLAVSDADFYRLDINTPIQITLILGHLDDALLNLDSYSLYLRGFDTDNNIVEDEPKEGFETVLMLRLQVEKDFEPQWSLISERAKAQEKSRNLSWSDRARLAPLRMGGNAQSGFSWGKGSVLSRLTEEQPSAFEAVVEAVRNARTSLKPDQSLNDILIDIKKVADDLGVPVGSEVQALLDTIAIPLRGGAISLHDEYGIPLRALGTGSSRLLESGLQRQLGENASVVLVDELEYGLEPHRVIRLIDSLGAKDSKQPIQGFFATHSAVALREFGGDQLYVLRETDGNHEALNVGKGDAAQGSIRTAPEAFLGKSVIICEGATEIGFLRGLDQFWQEQGNYVSMAAQGIVLVDAKGGGPNSPHKKAEVFQCLGYRTAILRDNDLTIDEAAEEKYINKGGVLFTRCTGHNIEEALFSSLTSEAIVQLVRYAIEIHGEEKIISNFPDESKNQLLLNGVQNIKDIRHQLALASSKGSGGWFKTIRHMEVVAKDIIGPNLSSASPDFQSKIEAIKTWISGE